MKKITAILLSIRMILSISACGSQNNENNSSVSGTGQKGTESQSTESENAEQDNNKTENTDPDNTQEASNQTDKAVSAEKTLVVYYSATGNTKEAGDYIAEVLEADIFELDPAESYSDADLDFQFWIR